MKCKKSFLSTILVLALILGFGLSSALAVNGVDFVQVNGRVVGLFQGGVGVSPTATSDPNMTLYSGNYTNVLEYGETEAIVTIVPADSSYNPTFFTSADDAEGLGIQVFDEDGILANDVEVTLSADIIAGGYSSVATIQLPDDSSAGTVSVMFTNKISGAYLSITVFRDADAATEPQNVALRVYVPNDPNATYYESSGMNVPDDEFDELPSASFNITTGMDALLYGYDADNTDNISAHLTDVETVYDPGFGNYVKSMTIDTTTWEASGNDGWMYGIYRQVGTTSYYDLVEVSAYVGADVYSLQTRDVVIWKYGDLGTYSTLFPGEITLP